MGEKLTSNEIDDLIINLLGEEVLPLVNQLKNKVNVSEFKLADALNITVNQVRNMLYRMHQHNLVTFIRKKDKKKGWYIYYWTMNEAYLREALLNYMNRKLEDFKQKLDKEMIGNYFMCPNKCSRVALEQAMEQEFHCQECGELMQQQDNSRTIENLKNRITELVEEIKLHTNKPLVKKVIVKKPVIAKRLLPKPVKKPVKKVVQKPVQKTVKKAAAIKPKFKQMKQVQAKKPLPKSKASQILAKRKPVIKKQFGFMKKLFKKRK